MMRAGESLREASAQTTLLTAKSKTRIGTWNVRTWVSGEMHRYNLKMLGLCETRWNGTGRMWLTSGDTIIYSGHEEGHPHVHGVALLLTPEAAQALLELSGEPVSSRLLTARFNSKGRKVTVIQCYAPTNAADTEEKETLYEQFQAVMDKLPRRDLKILMSDLNAKVGADNTNRELVMGKHGAGVQNENGERLTEFCTFNDLVIGGTVFQHKQIHKMTWTSPDGKTENQIDHRPSEESGEACWTSESNEERCSLGPSPGGGRPDGQAESLQRPSRQAIPQIQRTQPERQNKGWGLPMWTEKPVQRTRPPTRRCSRGDMARPEGHLEGHMQRGPGEET